MDEETASRLYFSAKVFSISLLLLLLAGYGIWSIWNGSYMICSSEKVATLSDECRDIEEFDQVLSNYSSSTIESSEGRASISEDLGVSRRGVRKIISRYYSPQFSEKVLN